MLEKLGEVLKKTTDKVANAIFLDKNLVDNIIRDLQRALIEADVNILLVKQLSDKIKKIAFDERIKGIEKKEHIIKILHDELLSILGKYKKLELNEKQNRILLLGLYGAGKTTTIAKLGNYYAKRGNKVALVGLDVHRPAAKEQLKQLAEKHKLNVFVDMEENDAIKTWKKFEPKLKGYNLILIDTAGRHNLDKELVKEIKSLGKEIEPTETILVMPADIGQAAKTQAQEFKDALNITGVIITRMDSTAKGGGALTACAETEAGIYFLATGEKVNDIEEFNPESFLSRLLGMGDLSQLIEKIKSITNEDEEEKIKKWEHIINSMTQEEKDNPELLKKETSRMTRISKGSGVNNSNIRSLLKQYDMLNEMMKTSQSVDMSKGMNQKQLMKLARKFGGKKMKF